MVPASGAGTEPPHDARARSRRAVDRALAIDPLLGQAHGVDACLKFMFEYDWTGAELAFKRAIAVGAASAETFDTYGLLLSALERYDKALEAQRHAHDLDPLAPVVMSDIASTLLRAGRVDEALDQAEALIRLEPTFPMAHSTRGWACIRKGAHEEGLGALEQAVRLSPGNTLFLAQVGQAYAMTGAVTRATEVRASLEGLATERYVSPYHLAYVTPASAMSSARSTVSRERRRNAWAAFTESGARSSSRRCGPTRGSWRCCAG